MFSAPKGGGLRMGLENECNIKGNNSIGNQKFSSQHAVSPALST